jgi:acyl-CoA reductase-like NAD-dependent aldehyde dehydrogenase
MSVIDGIPSESRSERRIEVVNPSDGRVAFWIPAGCEADADLAVASARRAFDDGRWSNAPPSFRKRTLHALADAIAREGSALDELDAGEMGKPVSTAFANAAAASELMRFYAEAVDKVAGDVHSSDKASLVMERRLPRGVVAAITPWNFPTYVAVLKVAPALAAGNCVVLKPSEWSSRSAIRLAQLALEAGVPPGVLNVVPGQGDTVGAALGLHAGVDMLTFTGSTAVGKRMLEYSARSNMKRVMAECGGKSPHIVFDDGVDLDAASSAIAQFLVTNQGQICSVGSRLLVQRSIEAEMLQRIGSHFKQVVMGDPLDRKTTFGPLVSARQCERVMSYIKTAGEQGASLVAGGRRVLQETGGYFVEPTLFRSVAPASRLAQEEVFGPVLAVIPFDGEGEAIRIANGTKYGLFAVVWTTRLSTGMRMAKALRSSAMINAVAPQGEAAGHAASSEPFGESGVGSEAGLAGMEMYLRRQLVMFNHA